MVTTSYYFISKNLSILNYTTFFSFRQRLSFYVGIQWYYFIEYVILCLEIKHSKRLIMAVYKEFGYIKIDDARINEACDAYFKWKDLNTYISSTSHRGINMPDAISEPMGCYCLGLLWNRGKEVGDATDPITKNKIEFKATSRFEGDLSSFGPKCTFDDLVFLRFKLDDNLLYIYDLKINSQEFGEYPANLKETIQDQKNQGRRPHISLQKLFVDAKNLSPDIIFDIRKCKIIEDNR